MNIIWRKAKDGFPQNSAKEILKDKKEIHTKTPNSGIVLSFYSIDIPKELSSFIRQVCPTFKPYKRIE